MMVTCSELHVMVAGMCGKCLQGHISPSGTTNDGNDACSIDCTGAPDCVALGARGMVRR